MKEMFLQISPHPDNELAHSMIVPWGEKDDIWSYLEGVLEGEEDGQTWRVKIVQRTPAWFEKLKSEQ